MALILALPMSFVSCLQLLYRKLQDSLEIFHHQDFTTLQVPFQILFGSLCVPSSLLIWLYLPQLLNCLSDTFKKPHLGLPG